MKLDFYLLFLSIFIFIDISDEIKILSDHFTFSGLYYSFARHPLAFFMIISFPYLQKKLRK
tara:strand:+ start:20819 stop:21001 length:183 start_codon:yes stop_codon:yes gene_type:complete